MTLYSFALAMVLAVSSPWWAVGMLRGGRYREGVWERLGFVPARLRRAKGVVWVHAVSVGEVLAARRLIGEIEAAGNEVVISTTTQAGQRLARETFGAARVFFFPLDFAFAVRRWIALWEPRMVVLMESEMWPRFLVECERAAVPVVVANARVSDRSYPRYMRLRSLWRPLLRKVRVVMAQSEEDARRWSEIGAPKVEWTGNLKYDSAMPLEASGELATLLREHTDERFFVCGSTLEDEERLLLECWRNHHAGAVMVLAPRHPQRFEGVAGLLAGYPFRWFRMSEWRKAPVKLLEGDVLLLDTIGELAALYGIGAVAFVGGSLAPAGGHNPLEPALYEVPILMGPSYENFREMVDGMRAADAIRIVSRDRLCDELRDALEKPDIMMGVRAREFQRGQTGAISRTMTVINNVLAEARR